MLTAKQIDEYEKNGFLLIRELIEVESLNRWSDRFVEFALGNIPPTRGMTVMRDVMVVRNAVVPKTPLHAINKVLNFEDDDVLYEYVRHAALLNVVHDLVGNDLYSLVTNVFNKPPGVDGRHPLHQDLRYFRLRPARSIVATWTAMSRSTRQSGCITLIPGSHRGKLLHHSTPDWEYVNFAFFGIDEEIDDERVHVEMEPGDTLLFHPLLIHGSGRNRTEDFRRSISTHYASAECTSPSPDWRENDRVRKV